MALNYNLETPHLKRIYKKEYIKKKYLKNNIEIVFIIYIIYSSFFGIIKYNFLFYFSVFNKTFLFFFLKKKKRKNHINKYIKKKVSCFYYNFKIIF